MRAFRSGFRDRYRVHPVGLVSGMRRRHVHWTDGSCPQSGPRAPGTGSGLARRWETRWHLHPRVTNLHGFPPPDNRGPKSCPRRSGMPSWPSQRRFPRVGLRMESSQPGASLADPASFQGLAWCASGTGCRWDAGAGSHTAIMTRCVSSPHRPDLLARNACDEYVRGPAGSCTALHGLRASLRR
jgi:hypothetical protein